MIKVRVAKIVLCYPLGIMLITWFFLGFVDVAIGRNGRLRKVINQHFRILIGNGQNKDFWINDWTSRGQLFPRGYSH